MTEDNDSRQFRREQHRPCILYCDPPASNSIQIIGIQCQAEQNLCRYPVCDGSPQTTTHRASVQLHFSEYPSCLQEVSSASQHNHSVSGSSTKWLLQDYSLPVPLRGHLEQRKCPQMILKLHTGSFQESCVAVPTKAQLPCPSAGSRRKVWKVAHKLASTALPAAVPPWAGSSKS